MTVCLLYISHPDKYAPASLRLWVFISLVINNENFFSWVDWRKLTLVVAQCTRSKVYFQIYFDTVSSLFWYHWIRRQSSCSGSGVMVHAFTLSTQEVEIIRSLWVLGQSGWHRHRQFQLAEATQWDIVSNKRKNAVLANTLSQLLERFCFVLRKVLRITHNNCLRWMNRNCLRISSHRRVAMMWAESLGSGTPLLSYISISDPVLFRAPVWSYCPYGSLWIFFLSTGGEA